MRIFFASLLLFATVAGGQASASTYTFDLGTIQPSGSLFGPCYCGAGFFYKIPTSSYQSGDIINFGSVDVYSVFDDHSFGRVHSYSFFPYVYNSADELILLSPEDQKYILQSFNFQGGAGVFQTMADTEFLPAALNAPLGSFKTFSLFAEVTAGSESVYVGWNGPGIYMAPTIASPVPESSTWAMMILAFIGFRLLTFRHQSQTAGAA